MLGLEPTIPEVPTVLRSAYRNKYCLQHLVYLLPVPAAISISNQKPAFLLGTIGTTGHVNILVIIQIRSTLQLTRQSASSIISVVPGPSPTKRNSCRLIYLRCTCLTPRHVTTGTCSSTTIFYKTPELLFTYPIQDWSWVQDLIRISDLCTSLPSLALKGPCPRTSNR